MYVYTHFTSWPRIHTRSYCVHILVQYIIKRDKILLFVQVQCVSNCTFEAGKLSGKLRNKDTEVRGEYQMNRDGDKRDDVVKYKGKIKINKM